ncbi:MAG: MarR family transcriptional regulator [Phycisphaerae bacterium]|nr:MarR family transcriptional regulator [Phycisphaerae bacterium]
MALDDSPAGVIGRILVVAYQLERRTNRLLAEYDLSLWQLDVLGALRRSGPSHALSPTELSQAVWLSSAAMTNRIDRLEESGLVRRARHPADRRGVLISLTERGREVTDAVMGPRLEDARQALASLSGEQLTQLSGMLAILQEHLSGECDRKPIANGRARNGPSGGAAGGTSEGTGTVQSNAGHPSDDGRGRAVFAPLPRDSFGT